LRPAARGRHDDGDHRAGRAAAGSVCPDTPQARQQVIKLAEIRGVAICKVVVCKPAFHGDSQDHAATARRQGRWWRPFTEQAEQMARRWEQRP
jgi:hypothetical protein